MKTKKLISVLLAFTMIACTLLSFSVTANAGKLVTNTYLDDETESKSFDQNFNLDVSVGTYKDVTKVKIDWTITNINATRKDAKVWNPDTLSWVDDNANDVVTPGSSSASFTVTNLSSVSVNAGAAFEAVSGFNPSVTYTGVDQTSHNTNIGSVVKSDKSVEKTLTHAATITVTVTPTKSDFANIDAIQNAKYGAYTIKLVIPD